MKTSNYSIKKIFIFFSWLWFALFTFLPLILIVFVSLFTYDFQTLFKPIFTLSNYRQLFDLIYLHIFLRSLKLAFSTTALCLIIAYPFAYALTKISPKWRPIAVLSIIIPFWISSLVRTYAIMTILKAGGLLNRFLLAINLIKQPLHLLYTNTAILIGCVYDLLPFMILPLFLSLNRLNPQLIEAARDLGASKRMIFLKIILPVTAPGILSGSVMVFLPSITTFYIPILLGGANNLLIGNLIEYQFLNAGNWPLGSAISTLITIAMLFSIFIYWQYTKVKTE